MSNQALRRGKVGERATPPPQNGMSSSSSLESLEPAPAGAGRRSSPPRSIGEERPKLLLPRPRSRPARNRRPRRGNPCCPAASARPGTSAARHPSPCADFRPCRCIRASAAPLRDRSLSPCGRYCSAILPKLSLKIETLCHSVRSLRSPVLRSRQLSVVATEKETTRSPEGKVRTSGSRPKLPMRITLLTLPAISLSFTPALASRTGSFEHRENRARTEI